MKKMIVKIIRLWPLLVLLFCLYCLYTLIEDSYEVLYQKRKGTSPLQYLACLQLRDLYPNQTEIDLKELRDDLYDHLNSSKKNFYKEEVFRREFELTLNRTKSGDYLVLNRRVCLITNDQEELMNMNNFLSFRLVNLAMKIDTFDFVRMGYSLSQIEQLIVRKKARPYSDCDQSNERFHCLNECFRRRFRLSRYLYHANETGRILLDFSESNRTIQESERICFGQCTRENCKLVQLILIQLEESKPEESKTFEAEPVLSAFDFWVEIVGLIFSFVGLFFDQFASTATKLTKRLTRSRVRRRKVKVGLFYLNLTIILLSLAYCGYLCVRVALEWQADVNIQEREMTRNLIHPKTVHLAICVEKFINFYGKTMSEIEKATEGVLDDALEGIYLSDGGRLFRTDCQVHPKFLFRNYHRCFPLSIQPNYQTIPSRPILTVRLKENIYSQLYVLSEEENLNSKSFEYEYAFQKRIVKRLKSRGCVNYTEKYVNCTGRQNCVERCIARKFIEKYNRTTFGYYEDLVIDRDWFSLSEWNTSRLMYPKDKRIYLNISRECEENIIPELKSCDETKFERTVEINQPDDQTLEIDLQFDVVQSVEELPYSLRMALDLLGIQSIFFGFTLLQLFWLVYQFTKPSWRWRLRKKTDKIVWFIICLLASLGCSWNTVRMLDVIVNGDLIPTEHYELAERVQMPAMVFCLRIDQKLIDRNHPLTGSYLEELTANITAKRMFKNITHLNESNKWTLFDLRRVKRFFLLDMKCFRVCIEGYNRNQFHFSGDTPIVIMDFKKIGRNGLVHFMTQARETSEFSKISNLDLWIQKYAIIHESFLHEHKDSFSFFRRHFPSSQESDVGDLQGKLKKLQGNEPHRRTLSLPVEEEHLGLEINDDHFEQLHSLQKNPNKRANLNYRHIFVANHLRRSGYFDQNKVRSGPDFNFHLVFLRRVVHFTNEVNYATLTLGLLNLLSLWLELSVFDLHPFLVLLHDHLLIYLYLHMPILLLRKLIKLLLLCCSWLKKLEPPLYELIDSQLKEEDEDDEDEDSPDSSTTDQPSVTSDD